MLRPLMLPSKQIRLVGVAVTNAVCGREIWNDASAADGSPGQLRNRAGSAHPNASRPPSVGHRSIYEWGELQARYAAIVSRSRPDQIAFFRHGQTKYNEKRLVSGQHDTVLSERGRGEAQTLREALPPDLDLIICSGLTRAIETMELSVPPALRARVPVFLDERLNEVNLGQMQGRKSIFVQAFADGNINWSPPGGESYRDAARRILSAVADMLDSLSLAGPPPRKAAVFCHAGVMRIVATLISSKAGARSVFQSSAKNLECLTVTARNVKFPMFWTGKGARRDGKRNSFEDS